MRPQVGQLINNKYRLLRLIGDGGMGSVYEARHEVLGTSVALKFLHAELSRRPGLVQRFLQEARVSAQIQSPHVVRVTDVDQTPEGNAYIVLEFLHGKTLQTLYEDLYRAGQRLSYTDGLEYAMQMLEGVDAAHRTGIVHRDLKPDNVMITTGPKGRPILKLLDFGIAKLRVSGEMDRGLTRPGVIMGTPEYMAPEQAYSADAVDARADVFSLGVMIFEMLAGRRPVGGDEPQQIAAAYLSGQIARLGDLLPGVAPELATAVHRAMAPLARDRWASASDFRDALEPFAIAAKAPSVMPSNPSLPGVTPSPSVVRSDQSANPPSVKVIGGTTDRNTPYPGPAAISAEPPRAVPKTWPPDEPHAATPNAAAAAALLPEPTPLGGFSGSDPHGHTPGASPLIAPTASAPPYVPGPNGADGGATGFAAPLDLSPRPSGTAPGSERVAGTAADYGYGGAAPIESPQAYAAPVAKPRRRSAGSSLGLILLLAASIAGMVVGGIYLAHQRANVDDRDEPVAAAPSATVKSEPPPTAQPPVTTSTITKPPPQAIINPRPAPKPSGSQSNPQPPGSSTVVPILPTAIPTFVLPSAFPPFLQVPQRPEPEPPRERPRRPGADEPNRPFQDRPPPPQHSRGPDQPRERRPHIILRPRRLEPVRQLHHYGNRPMGPGYER